MIKISCLPLFILENHIKIKETIQSLSMMIRKLARQLPNPSATPQIKYPAIQKALWNTYTRFLDNFLHLPGQGNIPAGTPRRSVLQPVSW